MILFKKDNYFCTQAVFKYLQGEEYFKEELSAAAQFLGSSAPADAKVAFLDEFGQEYDRRGSISYLDRKLKEVVIDHGNKMVALAGKVFKLFI